MKNLLLVPFLIFSAAQLSDGAVLTFDNGIADGTTTINPGTSPTSYTVYEENGMRISFTGAESTVGDYYGSGDNVSHWHNVGATLLFEMIDGSPFNLDSFVLNANTQMGGAPASGAEVAYITSNTGEQILLPPTDWGVDTLVSFGADSFKGISSFTITTEANIFCMGIDDLSFVSSVPEPSSAALLGAVGILALFRRRRA